MKLRLVTLVFAGVVSLMNTVHAEVPKIEPPLKGSSLRAGEPVGFVVHPHEAKLEELAQTRANAELANVFVWRMKDEEKQIVDFDIPAAWLARLYKSGRQGYPILDTGIHHSNQPWHNKLWRAAGENLVDSNGKTRDWASLHSPEFRKTVFNYIDQLIDWVKLNDTQHRIPAYINGAEWFWPYCELDYSPVAISAFRDWLKEKYKTVDGVNAAWGSEFKSWDDVQPVKVRQVGDGFVGLVTISFWGGLDFSWTSPAIDVEPGREYQASVQAMQTDVPESLCTMQFQWLDDQGKFIIGDSERGESESFGIEAARQKWQKTSATMIPPKGAKTLKLALKLLGPGKVAFRTPAIKKTFTDENLLAGKTEEDWTFSSYANKPAISGNISSDSFNPIFTISYDLPPLPYKNTSVAWEDWHVFSFEGMAEWLNIAAKHIKERDPSRLVSSYVGWVFGTHSIWEGTMTIQRLDISLANTPDIEINGIQMCIADDDFTYATCPIDIARKYGKKIYATDLIDFPFGLYSGFEPIYRGALAGVQHGMDGMFPYCWYAAFPPAYNYSVLLAKPELNRFIGDVQTAIETVSDYELTTKVAMIEPLMSFSLADEGGYKSDPLDSGGMYHLILDLGLTPDVITPYEIAKQGGKSLEKYDLIFISDCPVLDPKVNDLLIEAVKSGKVLVTSGATPQKDFAYNPLPQTLAAPKKINDIAGPALVTLGKGKVISIADKFGRNYWGKVRRWRRGGNTPAVFMRTDRSAEAESLRRYIRQTISGHIVSADVKLPAKINASDGNIHVAVYEPKNSDAEADMLLFLIHNGHGRTKAFSVKLDPDLKIAKAQVWTDFGEKKTITINPDGSMTVPAFAHSCIVFLDKQE